MLSIPVLDIYVTGICNLKCPYCFGENDTKPGMERATFRHALCFAKFIGATVIEFCGGEPLLYKDLDWAVESARAQGFRLILRTNGFLVAQRRSFIAENFASVGISLDGDVDSNDLMRPFKGDRQIDAKKKAGNSASRNHRAQGAKSQATCDPRFRGHGGKRRRHPRSGAASASPQAPNRSLEGTSVCREQL